MLESHCEKRRRKLGTPRSQSRSMGRFRDSQGRGWRHCGEATVTMLALMAFGLICAGLESVGQAQRDEPWPARSLVRTFSETQRSTSTEEVASVRTSQTLRADPAARASHRIGVKTGKADGLDPGLARHEPRHEI
jgi:hypothetical protein